VLNNKHIAKRGGWKKLLVLGIVAALCIVGLVVGLVFGLRNRHKSSS
jgi:F0F1-type ATP synthase membrane subunit c/vacuolar-type H+-ATPase subunit K